ncbi:flagellar export protein FliJ [Gallintestinimicrobium sp.]|uniref:flagellar export protein FliJ n=1 Tax=Gallintestinimicrobium sp. TaxID=2981655 RepID=UPI003995C8AB
MARRKKNMTYEEELTYLDSEISKTEETLKALKTRKKELTKVKEQADLQTLYAAIKESGKSVADVISSLK